MGDILSNNLWACLQSLMNNVKYCNSYEKEELWMTFNKLNVILQLSVINNSIELSLQAIFIRKVNA